VNWFHSILGRPPQMPIDKRTHDPESDPYVILGLISDNIDTDKWVLDMPTRAALARLNASVARQDMRRVSSK
jgi:hypothetical protein